MMKVAYVCNRLCWLRRSQKKFRAYLHSHIKSQLPNHCHLVLFQIPMECETHNRGGHRTSEASCHLGEAAGGQVEYTRGFQTAVDAYKNLI